MNWDASLARALALAALLGTAATQAEELVCDRMIDDFSEADDHGMPKLWTSHSSSSLKHARKNKIYQVMHDPEGPYLKAVAQGDSVTLHADVDEWDLKKHPYLRWRWRAQELPTNASEADGSRNDAAASIYVIWKANFVMRVKSLKFTWSSTLPTGTHLKKRMGNDHVLVRQSGPEAKGRWMTETVNVAELGTEAFPSEKDSPIGIALLTDGDATDSPSAADYGRFELCRDPSAPKTPEKAERDDRRGPMRSEAR
jgi:hypothetical protein